MENDTTNIKFNITNHDSAERTLKDGKVIKGLIQKTEGQQIKDMKEYCEEKKLNFSSKTFIEIDGTGKEMADAMDFFNKNSQTEQVFKCPYKLDERMVQVLYLSCIKELENWQIGKKLKLLTGTIDDYMTVIRELMNMTNPYKMRTSFLKYYPNYKFANIKPIGKPRGKSGKKIVNR